MRHKPQSSLGGRPPRPSLPTDSPGRVPFVVPLGALPSTEGAALAVGQPQPQAAMPAACSAGASPAGPTLQHRRLSPKAGVGLQVAAASAALASSAAAASHPEADPELQQLREELAALPAALSAAPLGLRRELLDLLRRQRSYVGVAQQVGACLRSQSVRPQ